MSPPSSSSPSSSSLPSPRPLPSLPIELKRAILTHADTQTLAICCRVSLAFLEVASELLYRDVEVEGHQRLKLLFCSREQDSSPQVNEALSLHRISTFTFLIRDGSQHSREECPYLRPHRFRGGVIKLDLFTITYPPLQPWKEHEHIFVGRLADPFDPLRFDFIAPPNTVDALCSVNIDLRNNLSQWPRIFSFRLVNSVVGLDLSGELFASNYWTVTYELSEPLCSEETPSRISDWVVWTLTDNLDEELADAHQFRFRRPEQRFPNGALQKAVVVVHSVQDKAWMEKDLRDNGHWMEPAQLEERMGHISVVVKQ